MVKGIPESWLAALPESLLAKIVSFAEIEQGRANTCFISLPCGQALFAKQTDPLSLKNEIKALNFLATNTPFSNLSFPTVFSSNDELLLTNKVYGDAVSAQTNLLIGEAKLANALAELHQLDFATIASQCTHFDLPCENAFARALNLVHCEAQMQSKLLQRLAGSIAVISQTPSLLGFIHGDLTKDNLLLGKHGQLVILDWELADIRDVRWDLATICEEYSLTAGQTEQFITDYIARREIDEPSFRKGLSAWRFIYSVVCFIWALEEQQEHKNYFTKLLSFEA